MRGHARLSQGNTVAKKNSCYLPAPGHATPLQLNDTTTDAEE